jgi:sensor histidine kinase YesM
MMFVVCTCFSALISLIRLRIKTKLQRAHTEVAHSKTELLLLQSQLSPHFLFNTLNNIYGLSLSDHARVPTLLLKLSDLLRYSVYEAKELFVPINEELEYLKNYIEFEKIRLGDRLHLQCEFKVSVQTEKIAPMLLIVFVENAFKHSRNVNENGVTIDLAIRQEGKGLHFSISNPVSSPEVKSSLEERHSGFGLENVKRRLALLYPERHQLDILETEGHFRVNLVLNSFK